MANSISQTATVPVCSSLFKYLQLLSWCSCPKIVHWLKWWPPEWPPSAMEDPEQQLDTLIEDNLAQYVDLKLKTDQKLVNIDLHAPLASPDLVAFKLNWLHWPNISTETQRA